MVVHSFSCEAACLQSGFPLDMLPLGLLQTVHLLSVEGLNTFAFAGSLSNPPSESLTKLDAEKTCARPEHHDFRFQAWSDAE